jgi:hypothetical protein
MLPLHPKTAQKMSLKSGRSIRSETEISRITIGLTWRSTARKVKRLKQSCSIIEPEYPAQNLRDPRLYGALPVSESLTGSDWLKKVAVVGLLL